MNLATANIGPESRHVKRYEPPAFFPLLVAMVCVEPSCDVVFDGSYQDECPRCGSKATWPVSCWLNRIPRETRS